MKSSNLVTCPNCKHEFSIESALTADIEKEVADKLKKEFNEKWLTQKKKDDETIRLQKEQNEVERKRLIQEQTL